MSVASDYTEDLKQKIINIISNIESNKLWLCHLNELTSSYCDIYKQVISDLCSNGDLFQKACTLGDDDLVSYLIPYVTDINNESEQGSALYLACKHGLVSIVDLLLNNKAVIRDPVEPTIDEINDDGFLIVSDGTLEDTCIKVLAANQKCCFYCTCLKGWVDILKMLIEHKLEAFEQIECCKYVLKLACVGGHVPILNCCIDMFMKLTINKNELIAFLKSEELVSICLKNGNDSLIQILVDNGCTLTKQLILKYPEPILSHLTTKFTTVNINHKDNHSNNSLKFNDSTRNTTCSASVQDIYISIDWQNCSLCAISKQWFAPYLSHVVELDLSYNNLNILPSECPWKMPSLKSLIVMHSFLYGLSSVTNRDFILCHKLEFVNLANNEMICLPDELFHLKALKCLNVSYNCLQSITTRKADWSCVRLEDLLLSSNDLTYLPDQLHACTSLKKLCLDNNNIDQFIEPWNCPLKFLDMSKNQLTDLNLGIENKWSETLVELNLAHNQFNHIPPSVTSLNGLELLNISGNHIIIMPSYDVWTCRSLKVFNISLNKIGADPTCMTLTPPLKTLLMKLNQGSSHFMMNRDHDSHNNLYVQLPLLFADCLQELDLSGNMLTSIPDAVLHLKELKRLDLSNNPLKDLPENLCNLFNLEMLLLEGIEFNDEQLTEMARNGNSTKMIQAYLRKRHKDCVQYNRLQVVVLGKKMHGKTSLCKSLEEISSSSPLISSSSLSSSSPLISLSSSISSPPISDEHEEDDATQYLNITEIEFSPSKNLFQSLLGKTSSMYKRDLHLSIQLLDVPSHSTNHFNHGPFFGPSCLYVVTFDLRLYRDACALLRMWLSIVQTYNVKAHVIIVGTFLDCLAEGREHLNKMRQTILKRFYHKSIYPSIEDVIFVSNMSDKEGIQHLRNTIVQYYKKMNNPSCSMSHSRKQNADFTNIPKDYIELIKLLVKERERRKREGICPILNEFVSLVEGVDKNLFITKEDTHLALTFLVESGLMLNFSKDHDQLNEWYFIDLHWLSRSLYKCFVSQQQQTLERGDGTIYGIIHKDDLKQVFNLDMVFNDHHIQFNHELQLLVAFEAAHKLYKDYYLLSHCIPLDRPIAPGFELPPFSTADVFTRIYKMIFVPHTLVRNLVVQLLSWKLAYEDDESTCIVRTTMKSFQITFSDVIYWEGGIVLKTSSSCCLSIERVVLNHADVNMDDGDDDDDVLNEAVVVKVFHLSNDNSGDDGGGKVTNDADDVGGGRMGKQNLEVESNILHTLYSLFALAVDFINDLIEQSYIELLEKDYYLDIIIPCPHCLKFQMNQLTSHLSSNNDHFIKIYDCIKVILRSTSPDDLFITCPHNSNFQISLKLLVPDLLLLDLPNKFHLKHECLPLFSADNILGRGGEGMVYRGQYEGNDVAVKKSEIMTRVCLKNYDIIKNGTLASKDWIVNKKVRCGSARGSRDVFSLKFDRSSDLMNSDCCTEVKGVKHGSNKSSDKFSQNDGNCSDRTINVLKNTDGTGDPISNPTNLSSTNIQDTKQKRFGAFQLGGHFSNINFNVKKKSNEIVICNSDSGVETDGNNSMKKEAHKHDSLDDYLNQMLTMNALMSYRQETMTLARLNHPCLISLVGACVLSLSYVMELSPMGSLRSVINEKWIEIKFIIKYKMLTEIISALKYLHEQNLVYKDMKPENLLVWTISRDDSVCLKLSDYGLTRRLFPGGLRGIEGTCGYQAPEIWLRRPYNEKVDIFAFAMVAFELMEGDRSFFENPSVVINKLIQRGKRPKIKSNISPQLRKVIERSWSQEPVDRPSAMKLEAMMKELSIVMLKQVTHLQDSRIVGDVNAACFDAYACHIHMWTGKDTGRCYHTYDVNINEFINFNICCPGSKVTHVSLVTNDLMVLVTEEPGVELIRFNSYISSIEKKHHLQTPHISTTLITNNQKTNINEFYLTSKAGDVTLYQIDDFELEMHMAKSLQLTDESSSERLSSAQFVSKMIWVALGTIIYIIRKISKSEIALYQKIDLFPENDAYNITSICSMGEQVWCLLGKSGLIIEIDSETLEIICFFDCSLSSQGEIIVNFNLKDLNLKLQNLEQVPNLDSFEEELESSRQNSLDQILQSNNNSNSNNIKNKTLMDQELERSTKTRRKRSLKLFRRKKIKANSRVVKKNSRIKAIECCNGVLWVGMMEGEMMLINVTQNNSSHVEYGQVLDIMCNEDNALDATNEEYELSHMMRMPLLGEKENNIENMNGCSYLMSMMSYKKKKLPHKRVRLLVWNCLDTSTLHSYTNIHTQLEALINQK